MAAGTQAPPKSGAQQQQQPKKEVTVSDLITSNMAVIRALIPRHLNAERMMQLAIAMSRKQELRDCTPASFVGVFMTSAQLGLELDVRGEAYAVPFWNKKANPARKEAQFIAGYKGLIKLATNSGKVRNVYAHEVREKDEFDYGYGLDPFLHHKPAKVADRGAVTHVYAVAAFKDSGHHFEVMTIEEVEALRDKFSKAKDSGPWKDNPREMCLKTVVRRLCKFLPASAELSRAVALDELHEAGVPQELNMLPDFTTLDATYTAEAEDPGMDAVRQSVKQAAGKPPAAPKEKEKPAEKPVGTPTPDAQASAPEAETQTAAPADGPPNDLAILCGDYKQRIRTASSQDRAVEAYNEAADQKELTVEQMCELQDALKERIKQFKAR